MNYEQRVEKVEDVAGAVEEFKQNRRKWITDTRVFWAAHDAGQTDFSGMVMRNAHIIYSLDGLVLDGAEFHRTDFEGITISNMTLDGNFENCQFDQCRIKGVTLRRGHLNLCQFQYCDFVDVRGDKNWGSYWEHCWFHECNFTCADLKVANTWECRFPHCTWHKTAISMDRHDIIGWRLMEAATTVPQEMAAALVISKTWECWEWFIDNLPPEITKWGLEEIISWAPEEENLRAIKYLEIVNNILGEK